jgi:hypothetical protein
MQAVQQKLLQEQQNTAGQVTKLQQQLTAAESKAAKAAQEAADTQAALLAQVAALKSSMEAVASGKVTLKEALDKAAQEEASGSRIHAVQVEQGLFKQVHLLQQDKVQMRKQLKDAVAKAAKDAEQAATFQLKLLDELQCAKGELARVRAAAREEARPIALVLSIKVEGPGELGALEAQVAALQQTNLQLQSNLASAAAGMGNMEGHGDEQTDQVLQDLMQEVVEEILQEQVAALQQELLATQASLALEIEQDNLDLARVAALQQEKLQLQDEVVQAQAQAAAEVRRAEEVQARLQAQVAILKRGRMQLQQELAAAKGKQAAKEQQAMAVQEALLAETEAMQETYQRAAHLQVSVPALSGSH